MFGEISLVAWMGGAIVFAIGGGTGFFIARQIKDKRTLELEQQLQTTQNELSEYQGDVNRHFLKTSLLFNKLTDDYREVYEHLATGAQKLCNEKPLTTALDLPKAKILTAATVVAATISNTETQSTADVMATPITTTDEHSTAQADTKTDEVSNTEASIIAATASNSDTTIDEAIGEVIDETTDVTTDVTTGETKNTLEAQPTDYVPLHKPSMEHSETEHLTIEPSAEETNNNLAQAQTKTPTVMTENTPTISAKELEILEANEQKKETEEDVHLGVESTPGVELEHHKTHPSIH